MQRLYRWPDHGLRIATAITIVLALPLHLNAQRSPYRTFKIRTCPAADSIFGPGHDPSKGRLRGFYDRAADMTHLTAGDAVGAHNRSTIIGMIDYLGRGPFPRPAVELTIMVGGFAARTLASRPDIPDVSILTADSVAIPIASVSMGNYSGPRDLTIVPVSAILHYDAFRTLTTATGIILRVGQNPIQWTQQYHRDLRALFVAAICPQPDVSVH